MGAVISPLLANVYIDRLDRDWQTRGCGTLVRYADDLVVMCRSERDAQVKSQDVVWELALTFRR